VISVSNVLGVIIGVVVIVVGLILLIVWWSMFVKALMALVPILLVLIGAGVLVYFISEIKSKLETGKEEASPPAEKKPE
jgi:threonine/homoserine/homoserine lactone efflux protein